MLSSSPWPSLEPLLFSSPILRPGVSVQPVQLPSGEIPSSPPRYGSWSIELLSLLPQISMVGALNKLPVAASGMLFFGDAVTFPSVSAILLGFGAGLVYSAAKSAQSAKAKCEQPWFPIQLVVSLLWLTKASWMQ